MNNYFFESMHINDISSTSKEALSKALKLWIPENAKIGIMCIGANTFTGDCLGPLTGMLLEKKELPRNSVCLLGTLNHPVHAKNLTESIKAMKSALKRMGNREPYILAVDACLGKLENVGRIVAKKGPLNPGSALGKTLKPVGDSHIYGIVNVKRSTGYDELKNANLSLVWKMAEVISDVIMDVVPYKVGITR